ncbi:LutC/YkgG family protein [Vibrio sp. SCSIO 43137]|uniref:LutC/YkgG family protein n=1 Tax=Vibrio sp. SCSIO 43137 TaxID=3021011 RepID=UPI0023073CAD|nr:lactate utilization protein C [Vibrio sp. SCSIO 43137]WCE32177.1 lactate utilization protein C [Vibrio sp. SCSIO 43137]
MSDSVLNVDPERIHNRSPFLDNIAKKLGREKRTTGVVRPALRHNCHHEVMAEFSQDELKEVLIGYTENNLASQAVVTTREKVAEALKAVCEGYCVVAEGEEAPANKAEVFLSSDARLQDLVSEASIESSLYDVNSWEASVGYQRNIELAERAKVGVVFAEQALAESGTMVLYSQPNQGRSVSLLPEASVFIVAKSTLKARLTQATAELHKKAADGERIPSCVNFISGPSSTADIELIKVVGVHGPVFASYIIIDDM